jgi:large subunit ribosomal protein L2
MIIKFYKPYTPGARHHISTLFNEITRIKPEKSLILKNQRSKGRNNFGKITIRHKGGGHKRRYRLIDFRRNKHSMKATIISIEYDPNRNSRIALVEYTDGEKRYVLHPNNLTIGSEIMSGPDVSISLGNALPLENIPLGTVVHNIEMIPNQGGKICRSAGTSAKILAKKDPYIVLRLPSKEIRLIHKKCYATIGELGNKEAMLLCKGKAGRNRWLGNRPTVRGSAMNACDHPHGGGEGRAPIGHSHPLTPWGKPALGVKTRKSKKLSNFYIIRRRN